MRILMITRSRSKTLCKLWIFPLAVLVLFVQGCATTKPTSVDLLAYKDRTKSSINEDVTVTVAVPTIAEAQAICGVELAAKHIQPVWLEVKNDSTDTYWFLPSGLDPDYFPPSEAAFALYTDSDETNRQLDENYGLLLFSDQVIPGAVILGYVNDEKQGDKLNQPLPMHDPSLRIILVTGAFAECFPKMGKPYQDAAVRLEKLGYRIDTIVVGGRSSSRYNAAMIARTVNGWEPRANERLILLGYSKGATDILHFFS